MAKDLRIQLRDRTVFVLGFVAPLGLAFVLNLVFGGMADPDAPVTFDVAVVDLDGGAAADGFVGVLDEIAGTGLLDLARHDDEQAARAAVDAGDVGAAWVIPQGFTEAIGSGGQTEIVVIADVDSPNTASFARAVADRYGLGVGTSTLAGTVAVATGVATPAEIPEIAQETAAAPPLAALRQVEAASDLLDPTTSLTAGMALFFVFFTAGLPLVSILQERGGGTLARMLVAPIPSSSIVAGKTITALAIGVTSLTALMAASAILMGAEWGPPAGAVLLAFSAVVAACGIMSVAGSLAKTPEQAGNAQSIVAVVLGILGGAFVPIPSSDSGILGQLKRLTPHGWFTEGIVRLQADGIAGAAPSILAMLTIGTVTGAIGLSVARRVLRR